MTNSDQAKLLDAGFTLARRSYNGSLLIKRNIHENWVEFDKTDLCDVPDYYTDEGKRNITGLRINEFLAKPKTILL